MTTNSLLIVQLLTQASTGMGLAAGLSWVLEKWPKWAAMPQERKKFAYFGMVLIIALGSKFALNNVPVNIWDALEPYAQVIFGVLAAWTTGTTFHTSTKAAEQITGLRQINASLVTDNAQLATHTRALAEMIVKDTKVATRGLVTAQETLRIAGFSDEEIEKYGFTR